MTYGLLHPRPANLDSFAIGDLDARSRRRVSRHLEACQPCRAHVAQTLALSAELHALDGSGDVPSATLFERISEDRRAGVRVILPNAFNDSRVARRGTLAAWLASAGIAAALVGIITQPVDRGDRAPSAVDPATMEFVSNLFGPTNAFAAQPTHDFRTKFPPVALNGAAMRPRRLEYARTITADGKTREIGRNVLEVSPAVIEDRQAWRITQAWRSADTVQAETIYVDPASSRLLGRTIRVSPYRRFRAITVRQRLMGDSLLGWMNTAEGLGRPVARRLAPDAGPYIGDGFAPLALVGIPLNAQWRGSLSLLGWAVRPDDIYTPVGLAVVGEERVRVPAGEFDCWRLTLDVRTGRQTYWVRKSDGVGVRAERPADNARGVQQIILVRD